MRTKFGAFAALAAWLLPTLIAGAIGPATLQAQEGPLTLEQCLSLALDQNPLVLSARQEYRASLARVSQARALPQPSLSYDSDVQPSVTDLRGSREQYIGVGALIPFPGKTYLRGQVARRESRQVEADVSLTELDLTYDVTATFYTLLLAREKVTYAQQNLALSRDFVEKTELKFGAGDVPRVEVVRARVVAANAVSELRRAESDESLSRERLNFLLARPGSAPLQLSGQLKAPPVTYEVDQLADWALVSRPEMGGIESALEGAALTKKLGFMSYLPDFDLGLAQHRIDGEEKSGSEPFGKTSLPIAISKVVSVTVGKLLY